MHETHSTDGAMEQELARLREESESLRAQLEEAQETLRAIQQGAVDALVIETPDGERVFTLQGGEHPYRALIEQMREGAATITPEGVIHYFNQRFAEMLKLPLERIMGGRIEEFVAPPHRAAIAAMLKEGTGRSELALLASDATETPVLVSAVALRTEGPAAISLVVSDLTEQKRAEAIRASEQQFRSLAESIPHKVWSARPDGYPDYCNASFLAYLGLTLEQMLGWTWPSVVHPEDRQRSIDAWTQAFTTGAEYRIEHRIRRAADGEYRWHLSHAMPCRDGEGKIARWFGTSTDIDDRKRTEEALVHAKAAAEAANVAKSQFLASMSHELRTPMNAILGMTDLALAQPLPAVVRDYLQTSKESADLLLELLNEILDFSRIEAGRFELESTPFRIRKTVEQVIKTLGVRAHEKRLELAYHVAEDLPDTVVGDPLRLRQVLMNLTSNAIKFTPKGEIVVRVEREGLGIRDWGLEENKLEPSEKQPPNPDANLQSLIPNPPLLPSSFTFPSPTLASALLRRISTRSSLRSPRPTRRPPGDSAAPALGWQSRNG